MLKITTIDQANQALAAYIPLSREITGKNITLLRMTPLMTAVGNPQDKLKIIHIAGTSGKTSTTYYMTGLLTAAGQKVGTTISPHVDSIAERVQINGEPLNEVEFCRALTEFLNLINEAKLVPTYFELLIAFAYWYFEQVEVDYAVIETGLGGLHDATNVATSPDKVCIITDIGFDHMHVLGNTIESIALQKAGIIHEHNNVFMYRQPQPVTQTVEEWGHKNQATLTLVNQPDVMNEVHQLIQLDNLPAFQQRNWLLAYVAYGYIAQRDSLPVLESKLLNRSLAAQVPARMDIRTYNGKTLVVDGAHNGQKMAAFADSFKNLYPNSKATVLLSLKKGKEFKDVLPLLLPITDTLIVCGFASVQDMYIEAIEPEILASEARELGFKKVLIVENIDTAYKRLLRETKDVGIITGSFYLISELRHNHEELKHA